MKHEYITREEFEEKTNQHFWLLFFMIVAYFILSTISDSILTFQLSQKLDKPQIECHNETILEKCYIKIPTDEINSNLKCVSLSIEDYMACCLIKQEQICTEVKQ